MGTLDVPQTTPLKIATILTVLRIALGPLFLFLYLKYSLIGLSVHTYPLVLFGVLLFSELSDLLDGYVARRWNQVTELGKILDPTADSIARISVFLTFTQGPIQLPMVLVFVFLYRDVVIGMLRTLCALRGVALAARPSGKLKAAIQGIVCLTIIALLYAHVLGYLALGALQMSSLILVSLTALYTFISGVEYIVNNRSFIRHALEKS